MTPILKEPQADRPCLASSSSPDWALIQDGFQREVVFDSLSSAGLVPSPPTCHSLQSSGGLEMQEKVWEGIFSAYILVLSPSTFDESQEDSDVAINSLGCSSKHKMSIPPFWGVFREVFGLCSYIFALEVPFLGT